MHYVLTETNERHDSLSCGPGECLKSEVELLLRVEVLYLLIVGKKFLVVGLTF